MENIITVYDVHCKVHTVDLRVCNKTLVLQRTPEVPEPQRGLWRQPKAWLQAASVHHCYLSQASVHHDELWNAGYWNSQTRGTPTGALLSLQQSLNRLHCNGGNIKQFCLRFVFHLEDQSNVLSCIKQSGGAFEFCGGRRHLQPARKG